MIEAWKMFWNMFRTAVTAIDDGVATVGVATSTARKEAEGYSEILDISRKSRHAEAVAEAKRIRAELKASA